MLERAWFRLQPNQSILNHWIEARGRGGGPDHPPVGTAWSKRAGRQLPVREHTGLGHQWSWVQIPPAPLLKATPISAESRRPT